MFRPERIAALIEEQKLTKKKFCELVDIAVQTLDNTLKGSELGCIKLERIADFFKYLWIIFMIEKSRNHIILGIISQETIIK